MGGDWARGVCAALMRSCVRVEVLGLGVGWRVWLLLLYIDEIVRGDGDGKK